MKAVFDPSILGPAKEPRSDVRYTSHEEIDAKDVDFSQPKIIELALAASAAGDPVPQDMPCGNPASQCSVPSGLCLNDDCPRSGTTKQRSQHE